ncbi:helix-hairpin-helix domain-containing protein [Candidatus Aerophobetes bacterium]|nr:helix-hairpin-helix domain-containing protein [Candidatus Aerophobetes bacterium]
MEVRIAGAVKKPGLYRLPENSSIGDLIRMAKGTLPWADLSSLDLTAPLSSDIIYIPEGRLNLNQASVEDLTFLPGIGPELARRIVRYREEKGGFDNLSQLKDVPGIGEVRFAKIKNKLTLK